MTRRRLSQRQLERIRAIQERRRAKLAARADRVLEDSEGELREGLVVTRHGQNLSVRDGDGRLWHCLSRQNLPDPVCGDRVVWQPTGTGEGVVVALLDRTSVLSRPGHSGRDRPLAANITHLVVVLAVEPAPVRGLLDQYLVTAENLGVAALILLNKIDLAANPAAFLERFAPYRRIGYPLYPLSTKTGEGLEALREGLRQGAAVLVGQSGVGKSSLVKAMLPDLEIQIRRISAATGQGRHTTSAATWYDLPGGGALIDSPGVRSFRLGRLDFRAIEYGFREIRPLAGGCRFSDCRHRDEPGCAVKAAVERGEIDRERYRSFLRLVQESEENR